MRYSIFGGTGFLGGEFSRLVGMDGTIEPRDSVNPREKDVVYFISTTDNYNVFSDIELDIKTNLLHLVRVLEAAKKRGCRSFNFVSSWFVYGDAPLPAKEDSCCKPKGFYSITKKAAEDLVESFCRTFGIDFRIFRMANIYGNADLGVSKKKNALQYLIGEIAKGRPIELYHGGNFYRDYIHVSDAANAILTCLERLAPDQIINIGSGHKYNFLDLIELAKKYFSYAGEIRAIEPPEFHKIIQVKDFYMDTTKLSALGFDCRIDIKNGINDLCGSIK